MFSTLTAGFFIIEETSTRPVIRHTTTVVQKVPVAETSACRTGLRVCAALATSGADPIPDSFENRPRATPYCSARRIPPPTSPPVTAPGLNASTKMALRAGSRKS